jgi:hypothetical protein
VIWIQGGISFLIWIGYGVIQSRRSHVIREQVAGIPRNRRGVLGAALFLIGMMVLFGGLGIAFRQGGFTQGGMTLVAWPAVTLLGLAFVHAQTMGMALLVSMIQPNVTKEPNSASINRTPGDRTQT